MKKRINYDREYKTRIVEEFVSGKSSATAIAERERLVPAQIYKWRVQLEDHKRIERVEQIKSEDPGLTHEQARKIRDLEEELVAYQKKVAQLTIENECLGELVKKIDPSSPYARRSSGYAEVRVALARSKGRVR